MFSEPIQARAATVDDIPFAQAMMREALSASPSFLAQYDMNELEQAAEQEWATWSQQAHPVFIAVDASGRRVGAIRLRPHTTPESEPTAYGYQIGIGVAADARHQGVGRLLMRHAISFARAAHASYINLLVDATNLPAIRLYQHTGFIEVGQRDGVIEMRRDISAPEP
ncbi:MAG TPA: GNAT family N-acetyltransferase [Ktedonobacterales bacterium]|nr:GNAT family N-acetyltransferase [Ktedonobacterales bacterium]